MRFPLFLEIAGEPCLVVGAGEVALRKKRILEEFGARVAVSVDFSPEQLNGQTLVVAATDERETNRRVYEAARARKLPVNVVDDPELCTFFFPAIVRNGPLTAAVSTGGRVPVATQYLRDRIAPLLSSRLADAVESLGERREEIRCQHPDLDERKAWYEKELRKWLECED